jgi:hypothetical protein
MRMNPSCATAPHSTLWVTLTVAQHYCIGSIYYIPHSIAKPHLITFVVYQKRWRLHMCAAELTTLIYIATIKNQSYLLF